jgi:hypothetical protein
VRIMTARCQVEALDGKFKDVITVATIKNIQGGKVRGPELPASRRALQARVMDPVRLGPHAVHSGGFMRGSERGGCGHMLRRQVRLGYDGWDESYDVELDADSGDFQPPGTCLRAGGPARASRRDHGCRG